MGSNLFIFYKGKLQPRNLTKTIKKQIIVIFKANTCDIFREIRSISQSSNLYQYKTKKPVCEQTDRNRLKQNRREKQFKSKVVTCLQ